MKDIPEFFRSRQCWAFSAPDFRYLDAKSRTWEPYNTKAPIESFDLDLRTCQPAASNRPGSWLSFERVQKMQLEEPEGFPGVMLIENAGWVGVDFDLEKVKDQALLSWLQQMIDCCPGYIERSPSGIGVRIFIEGRYTGTNKKGAVEAYNRMRFLRVTGNKIEPQGELVGAQEWLDGLEIYMGTDAIRKEFETITLESISETDIAEGKALLEKMRYNDWSVWEKALAGQLINDRNTGQPDYSNTMRAMLFGAIKVGIKPAVAVGMIWSVPALRENGRTFSDLVRRVEKYWLFEAQKVDDDGINGGLPEMLAATATARANMLANSQAALQAPRNAEEKLIQATAASPPSQERVIPPIPDLPNNWLFDTLLETAQRNLSKPHDGWQKIMSLHVAAVLTGSVFHGACSSIVVPGDSGSGKANPVKFLNALLHGVQLPGAINAFYDPLSDFSSGEAIRDAVSDTTITLPLLDEAGPLLSGIGSGEPRYASWQSHLPRATDGSKMNRGARSNSSKDQSTVEINYPRFVGYFGLQPQYLAGYLSQWSIDNGICGRLTLFPPQCRDRGLMPAYVLDRVEGADAIKKVLKHTAIVARQQGYHWLKIADGEALAARLHDELPYYRLLEPVHSRLAQMVKRWATIHYAARTCNHEGFGHGQHAWINLSAADIDFGVAIAKMNWDTLRFYIRTGNTAVGGETVKQKLIFEGLLAVMKESFKKGRTTVGLGRLKQSIKGYSGDGERIVRGVGAVCITEREVQDTIGELVGMGVLSKSFIGGNGKGTIWGFESISFVGIEARIRDCQSNT